MTVSEQLIYYCHMSLKLRYDEQKKKISNDKLWNETKILYDKYIKYAENEISVNPNPYKNKILKYGLEKTLHIIALKEIKKLPIYGNVKF